MLSLLGTRVVRGPSWPSWSDEDGGEGNVGTVTEVDKEKQAVVVVWDIGTEASHRTGQDGFFDLRVFDYTQTEPSSDRVTCVGCGVMPVRGMRWKCFECRSKDLCTWCYMTDVHDTKHAFQRFDLLSNINEGVDVGKREKSKRIQSKGVFKGAKVVRGKDWQYGDQDGGAGQTGMVTDVTRWREGQRDAVTVTWKASKRSNVCRVGPQGKVDIKYTKPGLGPKYYRGHLPYLDSTGSDVTDGESGSHVIKEGDNVTTFLGIETLIELQDGHGGWISFMLEIVGNIGKVVHVDEDDDIHVKYGLNTWALNAASLCKVPKLRPGDKVRVASDVNVVAKLQQGHGGWYDAMVQGLGARGIVLEVDSDGDAVVEMEKKIWIFNPAALILESLESERAPPGTTCTDSSDSKDIKRALLELVRAGITSGSGGQLAKAASDGNLEKVREMLEEDKSSINHQVAGQSALHLACLEGHPNVASYLLELGAYIEIKDDENRTPLHYAANGDTQGKCVELLLSANADANVRTARNAATPLHLAVHRGNDVGACVLARSPHADVNLVDDSGDTPLHNAIALRQDLIVSSIINDASELDPTVANKKGFNPLHQACLKGNLQAVTKLIEKFPHHVDAVKEGDGFSALHIATVNKHREIVRALLLWGHCSVDLQTTDGKTALGLAVCRGHSDMIELLVDNGASVNLPDSDGDTPLHIAVAKQFRAKALEVALGLLTGRHDNTPIQADIIMCLIEKGADVNYANNSGLTPLDLCLHDKLKDAMLSCAQTTRLTQDDRNPSTSPLAFATGFPFPSLPSSLQQPMSPALNRVPRAPHRSPSLPSLPKKVTPQVSRDRPSTQIGPSAAKLKTSVEETNDTSALLSPKTCRKSNATKLFRTMSDPEISEKGFNARRSSSTGSTIAARKASPAAESTSLTSSKVANAPELQSRESTARQTQPTGTKAELTEPPPLPVVTGRKSPRIPELEGEDPSLPPRQKVNVNEHSNSHLPREMAKASALSGRIESKRTGASHSAHDGFEDVAVTDSVPVDVNQADVNCAICVDEIATVTFEPCNHKVVCTGCSVRAKRCMVCKKPIEKKITLEEQSLIGHGLIDEKLYLGKVEKLNKEIEELKRDNECCICMEKNWNIVFPCGHKACEDCAPTLVKCPHCDVEITDRRKVF